MQWHCVVMSYAAHTLPVCTMVLLQLQLPRDWHYPGLLCTYKQVVRI